MHGCAWMERRGPGKEVLHALGFMEGTKERTPILTLPNQKESELSHRNQSGAEFVSCMAMRDKVLGDFLEVK